MTDNPYASAWSASRSFGVRVVAGVVTEATESAANVLGVDPIGLQWASLYDSGKHSVRCRLTGASSPVRVICSSNPEYLWVENCYETTVLETQVSNLKADLKHVEYAISHDLLEPIRNVSSYLSFIDTEHADRIPDEVVDHVNNAAKCTKHIQSILRDFLGYMRIDPDRPATLRDISIRTLVSDVLMSLRLLIQESGAEVTYEGIDVITGDGRAMYHILSNLISNAVKYRRLDVPCKVAVSCTTEDGHHVLRVTDNGLGIPASKVHSIFAPFSRVHKHVPGSGIGLPIVKRCVEVQGGEITVHSVVNQGTTFTVILPVLCVQ